MKTRMQRFSGWIQHVLPQTTILMVAAMTMIGAATAAQTNRYYVDIANVGNEQPPYMTWGTAATNIQDAVDQAEADIDIEGGIHCEVIVASGAYVMMEQLTLTEPVRVRSQSGDPTTTAISGGWPASSNRVIHVTGEAWISGFTVSNGYAFGAPPHNYGGGVFMTTNAAGNGGWLTDCHVVYNQAREGLGGEYAHGPGIYLHYGGTVSNCLIQFNTSNYGQGGGVYLDYGGSVLDSEILDNDVSGRVTCRGGIFLNYGGFVSNSVIARNSARWPDGVHFNHGGEVVHSVISSHAGRGVHLQRGGVLRHSIIEYNNPGITWAAQGTVDGCIIRYNNNAGDGGGVSVGWAGTLRNSLIYGNTATGDGGGIYSGDPRPTIENCTIVRNQANRGGGLFTGTNEGQPFGVNARNLIVYDNVAAEANNVYLIPPDGYDIEDNDRFVYSLTQPLIPGEGNIDDDPIFRHPGSGYGENAVAGNYRLRGHSPCIGAGENQTWMDDAVDLDGNPRVIASRPWIDPTPRVDMGAYETPRIYRGSVIELR